MKPVNILNDKKSSIHSIHFNQRHSNRFQVGKVQLINILNSKAGFYTVTREHF